MQQSASPAEQVPLRQVGAKAYRIFVTNDKLGLFLL